MAGQPITCGPFELDVTAQTVSRGGERLTLGYRGTRLLEALFGRPGEVLTKSELMDAAWDGAVVEEGNLSVQIAQLRKVLGTTNDGSDFILTVPRVGYRLHLLEKDASPALKRSDRRSIAVLPLINLSADPEQEFFADGLAEEIILSLAKVPGLTVIARNSSFAYKGTAKDVRTIGAELDVSHILDGSVRRSGNRLRMSVQLAETSSGAQLWTERYDRELTDVFEIQELVTAQIVAALRVTLRPELAPRGTDTKNPEALELFMRGRAISDLPTQNVETFLRASEYMRAAIKLDPLYARPHSSLAAGLIVNYHNGWSADSDAVLADAIALSERAIELDPSLPAAHSVRALIAMLTHDGDRMAVEVEKTLALDPEHPMGISLKAEFLAHSGRPMEAIPYVERLMRLDPALNPLHIGQMAKDYLLAERYETSVALLRQRIKLVPETDTSRGYLISALGHLDRIEEARAIWDELMRINPKYSISERLGRVWFKNPADRERLIDGVRRAGLPV